MEFVDSIRIHFDDDKLALMNFCLAFIMFGVALDIKLRDFRQIFSTPRPILVGLSSQLLLLPLLTIALILIWDPYVSIALGLVMVAACPGGNVSNFAVHLSRGNTALSVSMTSLVTLGAVIITPANFSIWSSMVEGSAEILKDIRVDFFRMAGIVVKLILIPLIIGMVIGYRFPKITAKIRRPVKYLSMAIFAGFILFAILANWDNIKNYLYIVFFIVIVHNLLALAAGFYYAKLWRLPFPDAKAISMETGIQNSGLGLIIIFNFFADLGGMALVAAWWGIWDMISSLGLALYWSRRKG